MDYLYHGSAVPGITALEARSTLHGTDKQIVYLTDSIPYALLYIWDGARSGSPVKHVTAWVEGGAARYEEQFPHQLERFYQGVSGWLYRAPKDAAQPVDGREGLFYVDGGTPAEGEYIPDVYGELLRHEAAGRLDVLRFIRQTPARQEELTDLVAQWIVREGFFREDGIQRAFMQAHFPAAWDRALLNPSSAPATPWPKCP